MVCCVFASLLIWVEKTRRYCYKDNEWVSKAEATASDDVISVREQTTSPSIKKSYEWMECSEIEKLLENAVNNDKFIFQYASFHVFGFMNRGKYSLFVAEVNISHLHFPQSTRKLRSQKLREKFFTWTHRLTPICWIWLRTQHCVSLESCAGRVNPRGLRVPILLCVRVRGGCGLNLLRDGCRLYLVRVRGGRGLRNSLCG